MIVILKHEARQEQIDRLKQFLLGMGLRIDESKGENSTILGLVGDTTRVDADLISSLDAVEAVRRVQEPYKKANRKFHPQDTMVDCGGVTIGHGLFQIIAGPCSVESEEQIISIAKDVSASGAALLLDDLCTALAGEREIDLFLDDFHLLRDEQAAAFLCALANRLPGNVNFCFRFIEGESMLMLLDAQGICASSGSACTSGSLDPSHVLMAIGLKHEVAHGSLRLSLSELTTEEDIDYIIAQVPPIVEGLRAMSPVWEKIKDL